MKRKTTGFTLAELMVTVAIAGTLLGIGIPAFAALSERASAQSSFATLTVALSKARIAAITRRHPVTVCPSRDGITCRTDLIWDGGWIVYDDAQRQPQPTTGSVLWWEQPSSGNIAVRSTVGRHRVRYQPDGMAGGANLTLTLCSPRTGLTLGQVLVNLGGRIRSESPTQPDTCPFRIGKEA